MKHRPNLGHILQRFFRRASAKNKAQRGPQTLAEAPAPIKLPATHQEAAKSLVDKEAFKNPKVLKRIDSADYSKCHPKMREFHRAFIKQTRAMGIPLFAFEIYRTPERQIELKKIGRSRAGPGSSPHQYGCAIDMISATKWWKLTKKQWEIVGVIGKEVARKRKIDIVWGGDWPWDKPHWQLANWKDYRWASRQVSVTAEPWTDEWWAQLDHLVEIKNRKNKAA